MSEQIKQVVSTIVDDSLRLTMPPSVLTEAAKSLIVEGVAEKADRVADSLRQAGHDVGLSESDVENALISAGLVDVPEPEPEFAFGEDRTLEQRVATVEDGIGRLLKIAERYDLRG